MSDLLHQFKDGGLLLICHLCRRKHITENNSFKQYCPDCEKKIATWKECKKCYDLKKVNSKGVCKECNK